MNEPTKIELEPMMSAYGSACFAAQHLESSLSSLLNSIEMNKIAKGVSNEPLESDNIKRVLGTLFKEAQNKEYFTSAEKNIINRAIKERSFLIHSYWKKHTMTAYNKKGRAWIVKNIEDMHKLLAQANDIVLSLEKKYLDEMGVTKVVEKITEGLWESDYEVPSDLLH